MMRGIFRPSSAGRWMTCAAAAQREAGLPDRSSVYAQEGTRAHTALEQSLRTGALDRGLCDDDVMYDTLAPVRQRVIAARAEFEVIEAALLESKVAPIVRPDIGGTADILIAGVSGGKRILHVLDLKYGTGPVSASTPQLLVYAWGAADLIGGVFSTVKTTILQPRARSGGKVKTLERTAAQFRNDIDHLMTAVAAAELANPPANPGSHCQFCKAKNTCREYSERPRDTKAAMAEFDLW